MPKSIEVYTDLILKIDDYPARPKDKIEYIPGDILGPFLVIKI